MSNPLDVINLSSDQKISAIAFSAVMHALSWSSDSPTYVDIDTLWQFNVKDRYTSSIGGRETYDKHIELIVSLGLAVNESGTLSLTASGNSVVKDTSPDLGNMSVIDLLMDISQ